MLVVAMPRATSENGLLTLASCSDGRRPISKIDGWGEGPDVLAFVAQIERKPMR